MIHAIAQRNDFKHGQIVFIITDNRNLLAADPHRLRQFQNSAALVDANRTDVQHIRIGRRNFKPAVKRQVQQTRSLTMLAGFHKQTDF